MPDGVWQGSRPDGGVRGGGGEDEGDGHLKRMLGVIAWLGIVSPIAYVTFRTLGQGLECAMCAL